MTVIVMDTKSQMGWLNMPHLCANTTPLLITATSTLWQPSCEITANGKLQNRRNYIQKDDCDRTTPTLDVKFKLTILGL